VTCVGCAAEIGPSLLSCPNCHRLVHAEQLKELARDAAAAKERHDFSTEIAAWRTALDLLPAGTEQHRAIQVRVDELGLALTGHRDSAQRGLGQQADGSHRNLKTGGALSGLGLLAWKFKAIVLLVLTKGKLLLLGLTNSSTLLSIIPSLAVYWVAFGWRLAAGLIGSIYVHEMGHVFALTRFGIAASAPMFLPGLGAVIRSRLHRTHPREEARVGIAGPIWGLGAAAAAFAIYGLTGMTIWAAIGRLGAWINLFNLIPVWQLDGARAFSAMNRQERWFVTILIAGTFLVTHEGLLVLLAILSAVQALRPADWPDGDRAITLQYAGLIIILSAMGTVTVPSVAP
jgi:Zn-dependent protease